MLVADAFLRPKSAPSTVAPSEMAVSMFFAVGLLRLALHRLLARADALLQRADLRRVLLAQLLDVGVALLARGLRRAGSGTRASFLARPRHSFERLAAQHRDRGSASAT